MKVAVIAATLAALLQAMPVSGQPASTRPDAGQPGPALDPTAGFARLFGLGGHACKQYDDSGRLYIYSEGLPSQGIVSWLQQSDNGTKANVPMPQELEVALPLIPGCMPGRHHAALPNG